MNFGDSVGSLQRAHIHEGSQLPGGGTTEFRLDWTHAFDTIRNEVKAGVVNIDGEPVQRAFQIETEPRVTSR